MKELKLIKNWKELSECKSDTHYLEINIDNCNGWIYEKDNKDDCGLYLSTHTFYSGFNESYSKELQKRGFDIVLDNWN